MKGMVGLVGWKSLWAPPLRALLCGANNARQEQFTLFCYVSWKQIMHFWHRCRNKDLCTLSRKFLRVKFCRQKSCYFWGLWVMEYFIKNRIYKKSLNENIFLAAILKKYTIPDFSKNLNLRVYFRVLSTFPSFAQNKPGILDPRFPFFSTLPINKAKVCKMCQRAMIQLLSD